MHLAAGSTLPELPRVCQSAALHGQLLQRPVHVRTLPLNLHLPLSLMVPTASSFAALLKLGGRR